MTKKEEKAILSPAIFRTLAAKKRLNVYEKLRINPLAELIWFENYV